jgi:hypothetical protein
VVVMTPVMMVVVMVAIDRKLDFLRGRRRGGSGTHAERQAGGKNGACKKLCGKVHVMCPHC